MSDSLTIASESVWNSTKNMESLAYIYYYIRKKDNMLKKIK